VIPFDYWFDLQTLAAGGQGRRVVRWDRSLQEILVGKLLTGELLEDTKSLKRKIKSAHGKPKTVLPSEYRRGRGDLIVKGFIKKRFSLKRSEGELFEGKEMGFNVLASVMFLGR